jgi:hypothetical protein
MKLMTFAAVAAATAALTALGACDKSRQSADGTTQTGSAGTAALPNGSIASTGSPEQGGANGTAPSSPTTINQIDRATPNSQSTGKANADTEAQVTGAAGARR